MNHFNYITKLIVIALIAIIWKSWGLRAPSKIDGFRISLRLAEKENLHVYHPR